MGIRGTLFGTSLVLLEAWRLGWPIKLLNQMRCILSAGAKMKCVRQRFWVAVKECISVSIGWMKDRKLILNCVST